MSRRRGRYVAATLPRLLPRCSRYVATTSQRPSTPCSRYVAATVTPLCLLRRRHCGRYVAATASARGRSAGPGSRRRWGSEPAASTTPPPRSKGPSGSTKARAAALNASLSLPRSGARLAQCPLQTRYRPATHLRPGAQPPGVPPGVVRPRPKGESDGPVGPSVSDGALTSSRDVAHFALPHVAPWASPIPRCHPRRARQPRRDSPRVRRGGNGVSARRGWQPRYRRRTRGGRGAAAKGRGNQWQGFRCGEGHPVPIMRIPPAGVVLR